MSTRVRATVQHGKTSYKFNLSSYLAECDANYLRLVNLLYSRESRDWHPMVYRFQHNRGEVSFEMSNESRYASTVSIVRHMPQALDDVRLEVRAYHDVQCAEVLNFQGQAAHSARYDLPNEGMHTPDEKSQVNKFLGELLQWCIDKGKIINRARDYRPDPVTSH